MNPAGTEVTCNDLDDDCDPATIDGLDVDGDGYTCTEDCDEGNPNINPSVRDICEDGIDQDCSGADYAPCDTDAEQLWAGEATVDTVSGTWVGTESIRIEGVNSGHVFCDLLFQTIDWRSDPSVGGPPPYAAASCDDPDGNPCLFAFSVNLDDEVVAAGDCSLFGLTPPFPLQTRPWGYIDDYRVLGVSYGPRLMYFDGGANDWVADEPATVEYLSGDGSFLYVSPKTVITAPY